MREKMQQEKRIEEVDILRGIAISLMILGHSFIVYPINVYEITWCKSISHIIYTFHMELLFIISGYVYKCINYRKFCVNKMKRILVPYMIFGTMTIFFKAFGGSAVNGKVGLLSGVEALFFRGGGTGFYMLHL